MPDIKIVIGGNFGDEGKGLVTASFADRMMGTGRECLVVLTNGGPQRGHTVVRGEKRHVFSHFGSGTFAGADTYFPEEFIVNPMVFMKEYRELLALYPDIRRLLIAIHPRCRVTTPFEMFTNLILEESRGNNRHGSVGLGIWETVIGNGKRFGQMKDMTPEELWDYLNTDRRAQMEKRLSDNGLPGGLPGKWREVAGDPGLLHAYLEDFYAMGRIVQMADDTLLARYDQIIFENGQGLLLDRARIRTGYGHHTTPSNTGIKNAADILCRAFPGMAAAKGEADPRKLPGELSQAPGFDRPLDIEAVYVTRTYMTRHGAGRFDTECPADEIAPGLFDQTNLPNDSQGSIRYGRLNMPGLIRRAKRDFSYLENLLKGGEGSGVSASFSLALTHLNEYRCPGSRSRHIRYRSYAEDGSLALEDSFQNG